MANIFSIAQSGLAAAQAGIATTGHNIANQATPGYNRQQVIQASMDGQNLGGIGFIGNGVQVQTIQRIYNEFLGAQAVSGTATASQLSTYYAQINKVNNMIADPTAGLAPVLDSFFAGVQDLVANPGQVASRQSMLSGAQTMAARFQSLDAQFRSMQDGVNSEIEGAVTSINSYAQQIAKLNEAILKAGSTGQPPNDLLDQRDYVIGELAKQVKVTVSKQDNGYTVSIGNGQTLVIGNQAMQLAAVQSPTDANRLEVSYTSASGTSSIISESALAGGNLGGLFTYRSETLDQIQNSLGRIAIGLASTFNAQHRLGQDQNGELGGDFFNVAQPLVSGSTANSGDAEISATITDVDALTTNDYRLTFNGTDYRVTRLPDNTVVYADPAFPGEIDGVTFSLATGTDMDAGDEFLIRPTAGGAQDFKVLISDVKDIAAAVPIRTAAPAANTGTGSISAGVINADFDAATAAALPATLTYDSAAGTFSGFPAGMDVTVTVNGTPTVYPAGTPVPFTEGATVSFGGVEVQIDGAPADGDTFTISNNTNGDGDNRNMLALGELQTKNALQGGTASYNSAYAQLVSFVGNKTGEMKASSDAEATLLKQVLDAQQSQSGVNLDEEATNLLRYQQAYQASGKVMQAASDMFDVLISLR